ncbi:hypothetical protein B0H13DRAFT_2567838 [Mycena leptocephala]|nr:hypothetical protein B0H13DRAFT_2567838 [Mycena leptocephala]
MSNMLLLVTGFFRRFGGPGAISTARRADRSRMANAIAQDLLNSDSETAPNVKKCKRKSGMKSKKNRDNSGPEDQDFTSGASGDDGDSDIEMIIPNEELADSLPRKTIPENAKRQTAAKPTATWLGRRHRRYRVCEEPSRQPEPELKPKQQVYCLTAVNWVKRNAIYLFYNEVKTDATDASVEGSRYYNFFFGNGAILEMTKGSNYNTRKLRDHLEKTSKPHFRLFEVLQHRKGPATDRERSLACGVSPVTDEIAAEYVAEVKDINQNLKAMFENRRRMLGFVIHVILVPWDQEHFEDLVAKWVAACDHPFTAVITDEFREMLEYTHHHSPKSLNIPSDESVKKRITRMSQEMVDGLKQIFKTSSNGYAFMAIVVHYIGNDGQLGVLTLAITTEESLIDFRELIGQHSGENMAAAIWETVEILGLLGRLLEAIGVLTKEEKEAVKSNSRGAVYQEAATESLRRAADDDAGCNLRPRSRSPALSE